jgi:hypothetical protein
MVEILCTMHENVKIKLVESILRRGVRGDRGDDGKVNLTKIYC